LALNEFKEFGFLRLQSNYDGVADCMFDIGYREGEEIRHT
jgi:hypothetical protein